MAIPVGYTRHHQGGGYYKDSDGSGPYAIGPDGSVGLIAPALGRAAAAASVPVVEATGALTDASGTIATGGTAQQLLAANANRRGLTMQNTSAGDLRVSLWGTASVSAGYLVAAGQLLVLDAPHCGVGAVSVWGATTAQAFVSAEAV